MSIRPIRVIVFVRNEGKLPSIIFDFFKNLLKFVWKIMTFLQQNLNIFRLKDLWCQFFFAWACKTKIKMKSKPLRAFAPKWVWFFSRFRTGGGAFLPPSPTKIGLRIQKFWGHEELWKTNQCTSNDFHTQRIIHLEILPHNFEIGVFYNRIWNCETSYVTMWTGKSRCKWLSLSFPFSLYELFCLCYYTCQIYTS